MDKPLFDVVGIGNAIVDVLSFCSEETLADLRLNKGMMNLVDEPSAERIYSHMGQATECSGGSAANTLAGIAGLGGKCAFTGKVKDDELGAIFRHDMRAIGVAFDTPAAPTGPATARCLIFVTPDGERTMNTFLGACANVAETDIDKTLVASGAILYIEGYLWDPPHAKAAIRKAIHVAKAAGRKVAFTLSDMFCVERHRAEFLALLADHIDILFANEREIMALFGASTLEPALEKLQGLCSIAAITRSEKGCIIVSGSETIVVAAPPVPQVVDTTGAGDLFAAGFLFGLSRGWGMQACAKLGNACAGSIIGQMGARSAKPLAALAAKHAA